MPTFIINIDPSGDIIRLSGIVDGTIQRAMDAGVDQKYAVKGSVSQALRAGKEHGLDIGDVAIETVTGAINGVILIGGDAVTATKHSIVASLDAAKEIGEAAS